MLLSQSDFDKLGCINFIRRMADVLIVSEAVDTSTDREILCELIAKTLDEAADRGIKSERLLGMYVLLRLSDKIDPYSEPNFASVLLHKNIAEDDKAHVLQMIRVGEISTFEEAV